MGQAMDNRQVHVQRIRDQGPKGRFMMQILLGNETSPHIRMFTLSTDM